MSQRGHGVRSAGRTISAVGLASAPPCHQRKIARDSGDRPSALRNLSGSAAATASHSAIGASVRRDTILQRAPAMTALNINAPNARANGQISAVESRVAIDMPVHDLEQEREQADRHYELCDKPDPDSGFRSAVGCSSVTEGKVIQSTLNSSCRSPPCCLWASTRITGVPSWLSRRCRDRISAEWVYSSTARASTC